MLFRAAFKSVSTAVHLKNTSFTLSALNCGNRMAKIRPSALWSTANVSAQIMRLEVGFVV